MGLSSSTTKTKETATTTPNTPAYAQPAVTGYYGAVNDLGKQITANPSMFSVGPSDLQQTAFGAAKGLGGWQSALDRAATTKVAPAATQTATGTTLGPVSQVQAASLLDTPIEQYLNPITDELVTNSLNTFDDGAGRERAAAAAAAARGGAFGGSRYGIQEAQLGADLTRERGLLDSQLRSAAYDRATGLAQFDAGNRQGANIFNAGAQNDFTLNQGALNQETSLFNVGQKNQGAQFNAELQRKRLADQAAAAAAKADAARADAAQQLAAGNTQYAIQQQQALAPVTSLAAYGGLLDPALLAQLTGQTVNGTSTTKSGNGLLGQLLGAGAQLGGAAILASDRRVKRDIEKLHELEDGLGVYRYRYLWSDDVHEGVMADEVEKLRPWALGPTILGVQTVNYGAL